MVKNSVKIFTIQQTNGKHTLYPDRKRAAYLLITALILRGFFFLGGIFTETRVAVIGIIVEKGILLPNLTPCCLNTAIIS